MTPNRITAAGVGLLGIALALAGLVAPMGAGPRVAAIVAGAVAVLTPAVVWLRGWQAWEARQGEADQPVDLQDLREAVGLLVARFGGGTPTPASDTAAQELGYVTSRLVDALAASRPVVPPVQAGGVGYAAPVEDPGTQEDLVLQTMGGGTVRIPVDPEEGEPMDAPGDVVMDAPTLAEARRLEGMDPRGPVPVDPDEVPAEERGTP